MNSDKIEVFHDWDNVILQINKGDTKIGSIRMMKQAFDNMLDLNKATRSEVLDLLLQALETTPSEE